MAAEDDGCIESDDSVCDETPPGSPHGQEELSERAPSSAGGDLHDRDLAHVNEDIAGDAADGGESDEGARPERLARRARAPVTCGPAVIWFIVAWVNGWPSGLHPDRVLGGPAAVDLVCDQLTLLGAVLGTWNFRTLEEARDQAHLSWTTRVATRHIKTGLKIFGHIAYESSEAVSLREPKVLDDPGCDAAGIFDACGHEELSGGQLPHFANGYHDVIFGCPYRIPMPRPCQHFPPANFDCHSAPFLPPSTH